MSGFVFFGVICFMQIFSVIHVRSVFVHISSGVCICTCMHPIPVIRLTIYLFIYLIHEFIYQDRVQCSPGCLQTWYVAKYDTRLLIHLSNTRITVNDTILHSIQLTFLKSFFFAYYILYIYWWYYKAIEFHTILNLFIVSSKVKFKFLWISMFFFSFQQFCFAIWIHSELSSSHSLIAS